MANKFRFNKKTIITIIAVILLIWAVQKCSSSSVSKYMNGAEIEDQAEAAAAPAPTAAVASGDYAPADVMGKTVAVNNGGCAMNSGVGLASSLLPREMASQEDFSQFAPDDILKGQNFLDPRAQIGMPETIGGSLRNANRQIRADPPNPKKSYDWNNSTIVSDIMQRNLCT
jgi:hypothetical protein